MVDLALHLRVDQRGVAFAAAPEHVVLAAQLHGGFQRGLDLHGRARDHGEVRVGRGPVHVARMREQVGRAPQQLRARWPPGASLARATMCLRFFSYSPMSSESGERSMSWKHQYGTPSLLKNSNAASTLASAVAMRRAGFPGEAARARTEGIVAGVAEGVPVAHRKTQVLGHGLAADALVGLVDLERQRIVRIAAFEGNPADAGEIFFAADEGAAVHGSVFMSCSVGSRGRCVLRRDAACARHRDGAENARRLADRRRRALGSGTASETRRSMRTCCADQLGQRRAIAAGMPQRPQRLQRRAERGAFGLLAAPPPADRTRRRSSAAKLRCCCRRRSARWRSNSMPAAAKCVVAVLQACRSRLPSPRDSSCRACSWQSPCPASRRGHAADSACVRH